MCIRDSFNVQARYEVGFDDEMLDLLRQAGFFEANDEIVHFSCIHIE